MVKSLEPGQKFLVPLKDSTFLPGYVVLAGNMFTLVNIFRNRQQERTEPMSFPSDELFFRNWLIGDHVFSRSKKMMEVPWILFRTKKAESVLPPTFDGLIIGSHGSEHVVSLQGGEVLRRPPTEADFENLPRHGIKVGRYYSLCVEAKLIGKSVNLDPETRKYVIE